MSQYILFMTDSVDSQPGSLGNTSVGEHETDREAVAWMFEVVYARGTDLGHTLAILSVVGRYDLSTVLVLERQFEQGVWGVPRSRDAWAPYQA